MKFLSAALAGLTLAASCGPTRAAAAEVCAAPAVLVRLAEDLPKTRAALEAGRPLRVITLGSSSTAGAGASATRYSYPSRLAVELASREPRATIEIINRGINGEDAWDNVRRLQTDVLDSHPDLVIWQMGTNAILHELDYDDFDRTVQGGIDRMRAAGIEVLLMDLQYAPRVTEVPTHGRMLEHFDSIGAANRIPVFHRYAVMHYWADAMGSRYASLLSSDGLHLNDTSYGCLAERLAEAIVGIPNDAQPAAGSRATVDTGRTRSSN